MKIQQILIAAAITILMIQVSTFPMLGTYSPLILDMISHSFSIFCTLFIYKFYSNQTEASKTILTYLMEFLMLNFIIYNVMCIAAKILVISFKQYLNVWFKHELCCIVSRILPDYYEIVQCIGCILMFKLYLLVKPMSYLEMNHELMFKIVKIIIWCTHVAIYFLMYMSYGTLCSKNRSRFLNYLFHTNIDIEDMPIYPRILMISALIVGLIEAVFLMTKCFKKMKAKRKIYPLLPTVAAKPDSAAEQNQAGQRNIRHIFHYL